MPLHRAAPVACNMLAQHMGGSGVRIILGGEGADEQFLGYDITKEALIACAPGAGRTPDATHARLARALFDTRQTRASDIDEILQFHGETRSGLGALFGPHLRRFESEPLDWFRDASSAAGEADSRLLGWILSQAPDIADWSPMDRAQWLDLHMFFIGYGMTCHGDRAGTGFQVETRFPFLDPELTRFAASLPNAWKLQDSHREKHILRSAYAEVLPPSLAERRKFGMRVPGAAALRRTRADDWVSDLLSDTNLARSDVVDPRAARRLVATVESFEGEVPHPFSHAYIHLLSVLLLEKRLVREYRIPDRDIDSILVKQIDGDRPELEVAA
jgi:asparagine synthase (glutamine-hydrolysing)